MKQEKLVIEGLEITYMDSNKNIIQELFSSRDNFVYQYVSVTDTCILILDKTIKDGWFILSISKYNDTEPEFNNYLITTQEADKIIRYFGLTGKQEPMLTTGFMQVGEIKGIESKTTTTNNPIKYKIIPLMADDIQYIKNNKPVEGFADFYLRNKGK